MKTSKSQQLKDAFELDQFCFDRVSHLVFDHALEELEDLGRENSVSRFIETLESLVTVASKKTFNVILISEFITILKLQSQKN